MRYKLGDLTSFHSDEQTICDADDCRSYRGMDRGMRESYTYVCTCESMPSVWDVDETKTATCLATTEMLGRHGNDGWGCPPRARKMFNL